MNWYIKVMKNYAVFKGRAQRQEFWMFSLFNILVAIVVDVVCAFLLDEIHGLGATIYFLFSLLPWLAVSVRRLHDTGRSGWWCWLGLVPVIGQVVLFVFMCQAGQTIENNHDLTTPTNTDKTWLKLNPRVLIPVGVAIQAVSLVLLPGVFILLGTILMMLGFAVFANERFRSKFWCLLAYIPFISLFILSVLQNSKTGKVVMSDQENLFFDQEHSFSSFHQSWFSWIWVPVLWIGLFPSSIALDAFISGSSPVYVVIVLVFTLPLIYFCMTRFMNKTRVTMDPNQICIQHGPLPWRKSYHAMTNDIVSAYLKHSYIKIPIKNRVYFPGVAAVFDIVKEHFDYHEVWIRTASGAYNIAHFHDRAYALNLIDEMKTAMNIKVEETDLTSQSNKNKTSLPPKSSRYI